MSSNKSLEAKPENAIKSLKLNRVIVPVLLGLGVVAYLLYRDVDPNELSDYFSNPAYFKLNHFLLWVGVAIVFLILRHLAFANRLRILSDKEFSWRKSIELIFIWEFSTAISPTSVGGAAVAFFVLLQERLKAAKVATIVMYIIVLDCIFLLISVPILLIIFGPSIIPKSVNTTFGQWTFYITYGLMVVYGFFFFYGLFINANINKRVLYGISNISFLKKWQKGLQKTADDLTLASKEIPSKPWTFHVEAFLSTAVAWSFRFLLINCLIIAFNKEGFLPLDFFQQSKLYAQLEALFVIIVLLPSPGGAGFTEFIFNSFLQKNGYLPSIDVNGLGSIIAVLWRLLAYYSYLIAGAIIIPIWLRARYNERHLQKVKQEGN